MKRERQEQIQGALEWLVETGVLERCSKDSYRLTEGFGDRLIRLIGEADAEEKVSINEIMEAIARALLEIDPMFGVWIGIWQAIIMDMFLVPGIMEEFREAMR